jgi:multiple sugar transport system permease protein
MTQQLTQPRTRQPAPARPRAQAGRRLRRFVWHVVCVLLLVGLLYPVAWLVAASFKPANEILSSFSLLPETFVTGKS